MIQARNLALCIKGLGREMEIAYILFGCLLGLLVSHTERWSDRNQKINDFINGLYAQLLGIHPRLVFSYQSSIEKLEPISLDTIEWINSMFPDHHNFVVDETIKKVSYNIRKYIK